MTNLGGRPPKYNSPEEMQEVIDEYFTICAKNHLGMELSEEELERSIYLGMPTVPAVAGLSLALGMSRQALLDYAKKGEFLDTVRTSKQRLEANIEQKLFGANVTGVIFNLKNNFGWKDKTEQELSGGITMDGILGNLNKLEKPLPDDDNDSNISGNSTIDEIV